MTSCVPYPPLTDPIHPVIAAFAAGLLAGLSFTSSTSSPPPAPATASCGAWDGLMSPGAHSDASTGASTPSTASSTPASSLGSPSPVPESACLSYQASPFEEAQYLALAHSVLEQGELRSQVKGGTGARAIFAPSPLRFSLSRPVDPANPFSPLENVVPLLSTKRMPFGIIREEFAWMVRGETNAKSLEVKGVKVWTENSSRDYLNARGLQHLQEGDIGPAYGFQWRHAGADYRGCEADYQGDGVDQLTRIVRSLLETPQKRKHVLVAWSPADIDDMAVPPCPILHQFYVHEPILSPFLDDPKPRLSCAVYQRSADVCLGLPFDLVSAALLTHLVAEMTDSVAHQLIYFLGDAHVYLDHEPALREQLARPLVHDFRTLALVRSREEIEDDGGFDSIVGNDFQLGEYNSAPKLSFRLHP